MNVFNRAIITMAKTSTGIAKQLEGIINQVSPFVYVLCAAAIVVLGIMLICGGEKGREKAKSWAPAILIGAACISGAVTIGNWVAANFSF